MSGISRCDFLSSFNLDKAWQDTLSFLKGDVAICHSHTFCTAFTNVPTSFTSIAIKLWLISLVQTHRSLPNIIVLYDGASPDYVIENAAIRFAPIMWDLRLKTKGVARYNFAAKIQALLMASTKQVVWSDCDIVFSRCMYDILQDTVFFEKQKVIQKVSEEYVAGGIYCISSDQKLQFYSMFLNTIIDHYQRKRRLKSDQRLLLIAARRCLARYLPEAAMRLYLYHLSGTCMSNPQFLNRYTQQLHLLGIERHV